MRNGLQKLTGLAVIGCVGLNVQDHVISGFQIKHGWNVVLWIVGFVCFVVFLFCFERVSGSALDVMRRPIIQAVGIEDYWRTSNQSPDRPDLQVAFSRIRNGRDGGGERSTARSVTAWMEAFDFRGRRVARVRGVWASLDSGIPDPRSNASSVDLPPTRYEVCLEIATKFIYADDAYLAGESDPPSLKPGVHRVRASIADGHHKVREFEWQVENPGAGTPLHVQSISDPTQRLEKDEEQASPPEAEGQVLPLVITYARYGVPDQWADVKDRLSELIEDGVLDFEATLAYLLVDPAPEQFKTLHLRWLDHGKPDASAYREGTHIVIPRSAAREEERADQPDALRIDVVNRLNAARNDLSATPEGVLLGRLIPWWEENQQLWQVVAREVYGAGMKRASDIRATISSLAHAATDERSAVAARQRILGVVDSHLAELEA